MSKQMTSAYGRIGQRVDLDARIAEAQKAGATITEDEDDETVVAVLEGDELFRAIHKGGGAWIIIYNQQFYPKPTL